MDCRCGDAGREIVSLGKKSEGDRVSQDWRCCHFSDMWRFIVAIADGKGSG